MSAEKWCHGTPDLDHGSLRESMISGRRDRRRLVAETAGTIFEAVAHLIIRNPHEKRSFTGTGFLMKIKDNFFLVTAAHNVMHSDGLRREYLGDVEIYFGRTGVHNKPYGRMTVRSRDFEVPTEYIIDTQHHDWAKLPMNKYKSGLPKRYFYVPPFWPVSRDKTLHLTGYPKAPEDPRDERRPGKPGYPQHSLWTLQCEPDWIRAFQHLLYRDWTDMGNSGSPLYYRGECGRHFLVGIHVGYSRPLEANMSVAIDQVFSVTKRYVRKKGTKTVNPQSRTLDSYGFTSSV